MPTMPTTSMRWFLNICEVSSRSPNDGSYYKRIPKSSAIKFQVFKGLEEVKLMRRSLRSAWSKASTVYTKLVFGGVVEIREAR
ncbi:hypothetical protein P3L10_021046 [Capsicum annuum]